MVSKAFRRPMLDRTRIARTVSNMKKDRLLLVRLYPGSRRRRKLTSDAESISTPTMSPQRASSDDSINRHQIEQITRLQIERGRRDRRLQDSEFVNMVISRFETLHQKASV
jgi:hypothetical protein